MPPLGLEPWTFLLEQAHSTQSRGHVRALPSLIIAYRCRLGCRRVDCESNVCSDFRSSEESAKSRSLLTGMRGKLPDRPDLLFGLLKVSGDFGSLPPRS